VGLVKIKEETGQRATLQTAQRESVRERLCTRGHQKISTSLKKEGESGVENAGGGERRKKGNLVETCVMPSRKREEILKLQGKNSLECGTEHSWFHGEARKKGGRSSNSSSAFRDMIK